MRKPTDYIITSLDFVYTGFFYFVKFSTVSVLAAQINVRSANVKCQRTAIFRAIVANSLNGERVDGH